MIMSNTSEKHSADGKNIIHVGLPKTGTTFLQNNFFSQFEAFNYQTPHLNWDESLRWVFEINKPEESILQTHTNPKSKKQKPSYNFNPDQYTEKMKCFFSTHKKILISSEGIVGFSLSPLRNNMAICMFLNEFAKNSKIIFIFRQQANYCESIYKQLIFKENRYKKFIPFEDLYGPSTASKSLISYSELNWLTIYNNYCNTFGPENVLALPYERLLTDPQEFLTGIENFIGQKVDLNQEAISRKENVSADKAIYKSSKIPFRRHIFNKLDEDIKKSIMNEVNDSNRELSAKLNLDLSTYGYFN